jgi:tRNA-splicing ligase RtcB (3'-phosphate/5'-hydroxy nucleic acid ligase)
MTIAAQAAGMALPEQELARAPIRSEVGERHLGAIRAAINCALANRQIIGHLAARAAAERAGLASRVARLKPLISIKG